MDRLARMRDALRGSREKQIGLAVLGGLAFILLVVVVWRVRRTEEPDAGSPGLPETAAVKKTEPNLFSSDMSKPTVVQPGNDDSYLGRRTAIAARGEIGPPSDPTEAIDPTATRHIEEPDSPTSHASPRVAQRSKPSELQPNPLRTRATEERPADEGAKRDTAEVNASDIEVLPPRRPLRRAIEADDEPTSRRSVYERPAAETQKSGPDAHTDSTDGLAEVNPLRKPSEVDPPTARSVIQREAVVSDEIPPVRSVVSPGRVKAETRAAPVEVSDEPSSRATVKIERREEKVAPVVGRIGNPSYTAPAGAGRIANPTHAAPASAGRISSPSHTRTYVVHEGDTIYDIAQFELGRSSRWVEIVALNRATLGDDIHFLKAGMKLVLPPDDAAAARVAQQPEEHR